MILIWFGILSSKPGGKRGPVRDVESERDRFSLVLGENWADWLDCEGRFLEVRGRGEGPFGVLFGDLGADEM